MSHAYAKDQLVEQPIIDGAVLESRGWVSFSLPSFAESDLREQLLALSSGLGTPTATRSGGNLCDTLLPTAAAAAKPRSLSKSHAVGEFPLHMDTAHWLTPCRYVMLACVSPGSARRLSLLMDTRRLPLSEAQSSLLHSTPLRVTNGRNSFFSTILSKARPFVRFDPGCMTASLPEGVKTLSILEKKNWPDHIETVCWQAGTVVVIDNWRMLHGRGHTDCPDADRKLLRISIR
jgi:alpha-ketoglutarate-dependent taurine dioxygenase